MDLNSVITDQTHKKSSTFLGRGNGKDGGELTYSRPSGLTIHGHNFLPGVVDSKETWLKRENSFARSRPITQAICFVSPGT